jgi:hypothetical protein
MHLALQGKLVLKARHINRKMTCVGWGWGWGSDKSKKVSRII